MELHGYETSSYFEEFARPTVRSAADQPAKRKKGAPTKQSKIIFSETLTIAEFEGGSEIGEQSEYAFKMTLPDTVTESIMI